MAELADASDLKSEALRGVGVRVPPWARLFLDYESHTPLDLPGHRINNAPFQTATRPGIGMSEFHQNSVSQVVWPRKEDEAEPDRPTGMNPRVKVLITTPIAFLIAFGIYRWEHHIGPPIVICSIALVIATCGFFIPPAYAAIERFFVRFGVGIATGLTWILLLPFFYIVFAPARLILLLRGKDPMKRKWPTDAATYWSPRPPIRRENYYRSQH